MSETRVVDVDRDAHLIIYDPVVTLVGQSAYVCIVVLLYLFFRPVVPAETMQAWGIFSGLILGAAVLFNLAFFIRRPQDDELLKIWRWIDKRLGTAFDLIAVSMILLLLPHGNEGHKLIIVAFCVGYVPLQMISDPENVVGNQISIVAVLGSFVIYLFQQPDFAEQLLAVLMILYGAVLWFSSSAFRKVVVSALANRRAAEEAQAALQIALGEVSAERDARTRFIATASHDLGQPVQAARLFADQLVARKPELAVDRLMSGLHRSVEAAQTMLAHLLHHMRLEADGVKPHMQTVRLNDVFERMSTRFANDDMVILANPTTKELLTDPVLLDRLLGNLVQNAAVHSGASHMLISARSRRHGLEIWVIDNGIGIAPDEAERVFEDYKQGTNSQSVVKGGFGLGLASARRLAALLGGELRLDARWTKGAAFCLTLPMQAAKP